MQLVFTKQLLLFYFFSVESDIECTSNPCVLNEIVKIKTRVKGKEKEHVINTEVGAG